MIYRGEGDGAEFRRFAFPIDQLAPPSARRVWRWTRTCVAAGCFMAAIRGQTSRYNRGTARLLTQTRRRQTRTRNRVARSRDRSHEYVASRVRSHRVVMLKIVAEVDRSGRGIVMERRTVVVVRVNRRLRHATSNRQQLRSRHVRIRETIVVIERSRW